MRPRRILGVGSFVVILMREYRAISSLKAKPNGGRRFESRARSQDEEKRNKTKRLK